MKNNQLTKVTRALLFICGAGLLLVLFTPLWRIDLQAPQYPEGLRLLIYANKLAGNVDIINGLNHYIGMKTLKVDDFPEFRILPGIIIFFSVLFMLSAVLAKRKWLNLSFVLFVIFGILAMVDFWRWEYDYGHHLDPNAAIIVPGMAYQPPLIGFKQLLNFGAWSVPDIGGWIFISAGVILASLVAFEWRRYRNRSIKNAPLAQQYSPGIVLLATLMLQGCGSGPEPIRVGKDNCSYCKMTISDPRYGAEILTQKGKVYKFDDEHCRKQFLLEQTSIGGQVAATYFVNFNEPHELLVAGKAFFLQSATLKTPMNGNIAAFSSEAQMKQLLDQYHGRQITWEEMQ